VLIWPLALVIGPSFRLSLILTCRHSLQFLLELYRSSWPSHVSLRSAFSSCFS
jgi:hypothetical protein